MGTVGFVLFFSPLFGFSSAHAELVTPLELIQTTDVATVGVHGHGKQGSAKQTDENVEEIPVDLTVGDVGEASDDEAGESGELDLAEYGRILGQRNELAEIHKPLGIATWASMGITLLLGGIQYHNLYGPFADLEDTPCVTGDAIFGQGQCTGTPYLHLISALTTTALYTATFTLSMFMPDPGDLDDGDSDYAANLRLHKVLRWVHLVGMVAQLGLGVVIANGERFGLDRANDYETLRALSTVHMGLGLVTWGALTWAGSLFTF